MGLKGPAMGPGTGGSQKKLIRTHDNNSIRYSYSMHARRRAEHCQKSYWVRVSLYSVPDCTSPLLTKRKGFSAKYPPQWLWSRTFLESLGRFCHVVMDSHVAIHRCRPSRSHRGGRRQERVKTYLLLRCVGLRLRGSLRYIVGCSKVTVQVQVPVQV